MNDFSRVKSLIDIIIIGLIIQFFSSSNVLFAQTSAPVANQAVHISSGSSKSDNTQIDSNSIENQAINVPESYINKNASEKKLSGDNGKSNIGLGGRSFLTSTTIALVFVIILIFAIAWVFRKAWPGGGMMFGAIPFVNVLGRTSLSPKQSIIAIKVGGRIILVGATEHHLSRIATIDDSEEVAKFLSYIEQTRSSSISSTFKNLFKNESMNLQSEAEEFSEEQTSLSNENFEKRSDKIEENDVLNLKNEINMLLNKVEKLKGIGSRE